MQNGDPFLSLVFRDIYPTWYSIRVDDGTSTHILASMKQIWLPLAILWSIVAFPLRAEERLTLGEIWASVHGKSNAQKAAALELQASSIEKDRREWHWAPRIYAEGRAFGTNDPVMSFSSMLQTRNLKSADLSVPSPLLSPQAYLNPLSVLAPDTLNHPVSSGFYRGILGIELPVYEGGSGQARVDAAGSAAKAREWELQATVKQEYAAVAQAYAEILIRDKEDADLGILNQTLTAILSRYQLGSAANPVGRSSYLGMQTLRNRIQTTLANNKMRKNAARSLVEALANEIPADWNIQSEEITPFADRYMALSDTTGDSERVRAMDAMADSIAYKEVFEQAKLLPQAGVFGEASATGGRRGVGDAYYAGFFVRMNLLSPQDYGGATQAKKEAEAARLRAKEARATEVAQARQLTSQEAILRQNIKLLDDSLIMNQEQIYVSERLFVSGAINALQMAEILSRRADLISARYESEAELIRTRAARFILSGKLPSGETK